jgi:lipoprotein-releasing system permease protein
MAETVDGVLAALDPTWFVYDWYAAEQGRYVSFLTSRNLLAVVMAMIVIVAVISVSAALVLLVIEKEDDIAVLRATGVSSRTITVAFIFAGLIIAGAGALIGTGIGILIALWINEVLAGLEVALSWVTGQAVDIINSDFYLQQIPVEIDWVSVAGSIALVLVAALFAAFIPARRAARILPDRVLRRHVR